MSKRGENIYKRKDGRWEGRYKTKSTANGKMRYISVYGRTYTEVKEKIRQIRPDDITDPKCRFTVMRLCEEWLNNKAYSIKESTLANYRMKLEKYIFPYLGILKYEQLTEQVLENFLDHLLSETGLSAKYVSDILSIIKSVAKYAHKKYGCINIIADTSHPKSQQPESKTTLSRSDVNILLCTVMDNTDLTKLGVLISLYTGIRIGELCALKWSDIDLDSNVLSINRTVQRISESGGKGTKLIFQPPKSSSSRRLIPLPETLTPLLHSFEGEKEHFILSGSSKCIEPRTMQYRFKSILKRSGLPSVNFHILRHTFATYCLTLGFDIKTLSEILGHSSAQITMRCYIHSSLERKRQCMELIKGFDKPSEFSSGKK